MSIVEEVIKAKEERRAQLQASLKEVLDGLKRLGAQEVWLFGSVATGEVDITSDLDLLVVMPNTRGTKEWMDTVFREITPSVSMDILVFNEKDLQMDLPQSPLLQRILKEGKRVL